MYFYLIQLENGKLYALKNRHKNLDLNKLPSIDWLLIHRPIKVLVHRKSNSMKINDYVIYYMDIYGIDNVRGGDYINVALPNKVKVEICKRGRTIKNKYVAHNVPRKYTLWQRFLDCIYGIDVDEEPLI